MRRRPKRSTLDKTRAPPQPAAQAESVRGLAWVRCQDGPVIVGVAAVVIVSVALIRRAGRREWSFDPRFVRLGLTMVASGILVYVLVWVVNGGHIPSTADAIRTAGLSTRGSGGGRVPELLDRQLGLFGDLIAWPAPLPFASVVGAPQLLALVGVAIAFRLPRSSPALTRIELDAGQFWWDAPGGAELLEIRVLATVLRASDARLGVDVAAGRGVVVVLEGEVELESSRGSEVISEGFGIELGPEGPTGPPEQLRAQEVADDPWLGPHLADVGRGRRRSGVVAVARGWPLPAVLGSLVVVGMVLVTYVVQIAAVPSASMSPTLDPGDRVLVAKATGAPAPPDVVEFERPVSMNEGPKFLVKRVIAVGGQTVVIGGDGHVRIDGRVIVEPYLPRGTVTNANCGPRGAVAVPPGGLYVLGDNRGESFDSRCFGPIGPDQLVGTVVRRILPIGGTP